MRRPRSKRVGIDSDSTSLAKVQLQDEIGKLQQQLQDLHLSDDDDFSKVHSYREMINSRRQMLSRLPR